MGIIIGADIVLSQFKEEALESIVSEELLELLGNSECNIFNLECPIVDTEKPIKKQGKNYIAPIKSAYVLKKINVHTVTLANNHIMDQDFQGLQSTMKTMDKLGISYVGAGEKLSTAWKPLFVNANEEKIGIYACVEHEFSTAGETKPGANPFDPLEAPDHIAQMKNKCDYIIVLYHGGKEYYPYPSPNLQKVCRKLIERGADLVVCQHSHCVGCKEEYLHGTIVYGQGDFISSHSQKVENVNIYEGLLISITENKKIEFIPISRQNDKLKARIAIGEQAESIIRGFEKRSEEIKKPEAINRRYRDLANENVSNYLISLMGKKRSLWFRALNRITGFKYQKKIAKKQIMNYGTIIRNYIECESHRELFLKALQDR